jgi:putative lipoprotein
MRLPIRPLVVLAALALLVGCVTQVETVTPSRSSKASARTMVNLNGTVTYRNGGPLPEGAEVTVEAFDLSQGSALTTPVSQTRWNTAGEQVPLPFTLTIDQARLQRGKRIAIRATIRVDGATAYYSSAPFVIDGGIPPVPLDLIVVPPAR